MKTSQELAPCFALLGDTQRTMAYQVLLGKEANNHSERVSLLQEIRERGPAFLLMLGDLVTYGHSEKDWAYFDELTRGLPLLAAVGNHDYFFFKDKARDHLRARFESLRERTWYTHRIGDLALVVLDSNKSVLGSHWEKQLGWFQHELEELEADPSVKGIIVCGHHPPFTNSFEIGPHKPTQKEILPHFLKAKKTLAYVSGHCHAYERFEKEGKTFIVSGGGGGPRQSLRLGSRARYEDSFSGGRLRPFHYLWVGLRREGLHVKVRGLEKGDARIFTMESFELRW